MKKWEYQIIAATSTLDEESGAFCDRLNDAGRQGWKVVQPCHINAYDAFLIEREVADNPAVADALADKSAPAESPLDEEYAKTMRDETHDDPEARSAQCNSWRECRCNCHDSGGQMVHCVPCCEQCGICNANVVFGDMDAHVRECHPERVREHVRQ